MYDIWVSQENPALHVVVRQGAPLGEETKTRTWTFMGTGAVVPEVAAVVERDGRAEVMSVVPFDPATPLGTGSGVQGEQWQIPR